jgi:pre-mRNA-splicing factor 38A
MTDFASSSSIKGGKVESAHARDAGTLVEKITRLKIFNAAYWKQFCFGLTAETMLDRAVELKFYGGMYGGSGRPSPFVCLLLKMLQLKPDMDVVTEYIFNEDFKYLRLLGAMYLRLTGTAEHVYRVLEPLYTDYRQVAFRAASGWEIRHVDEFIDDLLTQELVCDITLPYLLPRHVLEQRGVLQPRSSSLPAELTCDEALDQAASQARAEAAAQAASQATEAETNGPADAPGAAEEGSTEHWNNIRASLGLKELK